MKFYLLGLMALMVALSGCASHPEEVPKLRGDTLPALKIPSLSPQTVDFTVKSTRLINTQFGNTPQVEAAVKNAFLWSIYHGGLTVNAKSPNKLSLLIEDCPSNTDVNLECVSLSLKLVTKRYQLSVAGRMSNGLQHMEGGGSIPGMGDISRSYQESAAMVIDDLPKQVKKFINWPTK